MCATEPWFISSMLTIDTLKTDIDSNEVADTHITGVYRVRLGIDDSILTITDGYHMILINRIYKIT